MALVWVRERALSSVVVTTAVCAALLSAAADPARAEEPPASTTTTTVATTTTTSPTTTTTTTTTPADPSDTTTTTAGTVAPTSTPAKTPKPKPKPKFIPVKRYSVKRTLVFPVVGVTKYWDGFGDCRDNCTREHHGIDILTYGWKGLPVVAAHAGTVVKVTYDEGNAGCSVRIRGRDRWETRYLHLNSDVPGTDEMGFQCPAPGIEVGTQVVAGQVIGYIGDSGNSEHTVPHLHFELRSRSGYPIDPYRSLRAARHVTFEWMSSDLQATTIGLTSASRFDDVRTLLIVCNDELEALTANEDFATILQAPVVGIDPSDPVPALEEIARLDPERIVVLSDEHARQIQELVRHLAPIVASGPIPVVEEDPFAFEPDALEPHSWIPNPPDRFPTIIAGAVHKIWRSKQEAYDAFITDHRAVVLAADRWAPRGLGQGVRSYPGKYADSTVLWWPSFEGWVSTDSIDDVPDPGIAYVTEKRAEPHTLTFLGSLAELPPMPVWRSS